MGPYCVTDVMLNDTYKVERSDQKSTQDEAPLKPYWASSDAAEQAPPPLEPTRCLIMR